MAFEQTEGGCIFGTRTDPLAALSISHLHTIFKSDFTGFYEWENEIEKFERINSDRKSTTNIVNSLSIFHLKDVVPFSSLRSIVSYYS